LSAGTNTRLGILLMVATTLVFALQDGLSLHLSSTYNVYMVVMVRYWFFAAFVMTFSAKQAGGLRNAARTKQPVLQAFRGVLLAAEICVMVTGFTLLGMVESLAIFSAYTLIVAALSGPILGETVGWRRWLAIAVGFGGVLVILKPGFGVFSPYAIIPFCATFMFALYSLLTRYVARLDSTATSFFWTGVMGCLLMSAIGAFHFENMSPSDWGLMFCLCGASIGVLIFGEVVRPNVAIGALLVVTAGLFTLWRAKVAKS
jgi:drug/metabolite transporter (DMT)-like permease